MVFKPDPPAHHLGCTVQLQLRPEHQAYLNALPGGGHHIGSSLRCDLQIDHPGPHLAEAQGAGTPGHLDEPLWIEFAQPDTYQAMRFAPSCPAEYGEHEHYENVPCVSIEGHWGEHTWELDYGPLPAPPWDR